METIYPVLLCGGVGSRLWPLSRQAKPKQFLSLLDKEQSLFQSTIARLKNFSHQANVYNGFAIGEMTCIGAGMVDGAMAHQFFIYEQLQAMGATANILLEPMARDSGPAILAACLHHQQQVGDKHGALLILPCDHYMAHPQEFYRSLAVAMEKLSTERDAIVTFGIMPHAASKNYGYILPDSKQAEKKQGDKKQGDKNIDCLPVITFKEKPDEKTAQHYIEQGYLWNSGIFLFYPETVIAAYQRLQPDTYKEVLAAVTGMVRDPSPQWPFWWLVEEAYKKIKPLSFDYAIMEKNKKNFVVTMNKNSNWGWSDLGSFDEIKRLHQQDKDGNAIHQVDDKTPPVVLHQSTNNLVMNSGGQTIALLGVEDKAVIATKDALLVADWQYLSEMKELVKKLQAGNGNITAHHSAVTRPWGYYESLKVDDGYQVKKLFLKPGAKISLQKHRHRSEHWVVVKGKAKVTLGDSAETLQEKILLANQSIYLPVGIIHRLENIGEGDLELIEVQTGSYLGEDDIERIEDIYRRK